MSHSQKRPHYLLHRTRLRKKFNSNGIESLEEYEIIELFLTFVIPQRDVKKEAKEIIKKFGSIKGFFEARDEDLKEIKYFKEKALTLRKFIKEISLLYQKQLVENNTFKNRAKLVEYCINKIGFLKHEELWLLTLDSKNSIIKENLISKGLTDRAPVYPRKIIELAIQQQAHGIILVHNHPNGKVKASEYDKTITKALDIPLKILNIKLYDHIIVAEKNYFSFREEGLID